MIKERMKGFPQLVLECYKACSTLANFNLLNENAN